MRIFHSSNRDASNLSERRRLLPYRSGRAATILFALFAAIAIMPAAAQQSTDSGQQVDKVLQEQVKVDNAAAKSQKQVTELTDAAQVAAARYAQVLAQAKSYEEYNKNLAQQVQAQQIEMTSIERQLKGVQDTSRQIQPLMEQMVASLAKFVSLDLPFLPEQRTQRVQGLQSLLGRVDVTISEKYRQILQAYMIELGYGRTLGAYKGTLGQGKDARTVQFVRVGRVTLMFQTLDGSQTGYWNADKHQWVVDNDYAGAFKTALNMASKKGTPELLTVPVQAPQEAQP